MIDGPKSKAVIISLRYVIYCSNNGLSRPYFASRAAFAASEIEDEIKNGVDYVAEARRNEDEKKSPSSIIKFEKNGTFAVLRK